MIPKLLLTIAVSSAFFAANAQNKNDLLFNSTKAELPLTKSGFFKRAEMKKPQHTLLFDWNENTNDWDMNEPDTFYTTYSNNGTVASVITIRTYAQTSHKENTTYFYNTRGQKIAEYNLGWNNQESRWDTSSFFLNEYDSLGNEAGYEYYTYDNGAKKLNQSEKKTLTYTPNGLPIGAIVTSWSDEQLKFLPYSKETYTYNNDGSLLELAMGEWDSVSGTYLNRLKMSSFVWHKWNGMLNESSQPLSFESYEWQNGAYLKDNRVTFVYEGDLEKEMKDEDWINNEWKVSYWVQYDFTYTDNVLTERIRKYWDNNALKNSQKEVYSNFVTINGVSSISNKSNLLQLYPNPASENFQITVSGESKNLQLEIFDLSGRLLSNAQLIEKETIIDRNGLEAGIYFYRVMSASGLVAAGKLMFE